ncbi:hypothetical protein HNQ37_000246 [Lactovum miscens]|uniref:histidine kinase n=1 Tax=Lactovum miscens TaxID=190387 RepID=A0A841C0F1_9LACT|nr:sensor histidine kinase [Lactovum miscens]MBB5887376.1 hypothetical protein [Lactovum miscens]
MLAELKDKDLANKEFLDLIKVWSHQMKVPLAAIDLMSQTNLNEKELKSELRNQTFTLENYLNILLETQRITNLTNDFRFEKVSFSSLMKNLLRKYSSFFIEKNLSVELSGDWELVSDGRWLSLALEQLLNNAVKYTTSGSIKIQMTEGELQLSDTGIGIMSEDLPRLFEHGFTGYNGRIQKKSSGLGLYLTQLIFKKLEFEVAIESKLGKGTMVIVRKVEK